MTEYDTIIDCTPSHTGEGYDCTLGSGRVMYSSYAHSVGNFKIEYITTKTPLEFKREYLILDELKPCKLTTFKVMLINQYPRIILGIIFGYLWTTK